MQVVIMAGGRGTRLSEETINVPKPMVRIGDLPILLHLMEYFASFGHRDFVIALGYKSHVIKEYFINYLRMQGNLEINLETGEVKSLTTPSQLWNVKLIETGDETGTGGRLVRLEKHLEDEFFYTYGDGLADVDLNQLRDRHLSSGKLATVTSVRPPSRFGSLEITGDTVLNFKEKLPEEAGWINGGFFIMKKSVLTFIKDDSEMFEGQPIERLVSAGELSAFKHEGFWQPMDTLRDKMLLEKMWSSGIAKWKR
jgi:glucose-1-phosphate cytidylyltransferase